jgi:hypothetical protein
MKRKTLRRRPEVEALESMTLLSGMAGAVHEAATAVPNPLNLTGSVHGFVTAKSPSAPTGTVNASGTVSPVGKVSIAGKVALASVSGTPQALALTTPKGKLILSASLTGSAATGFSGTYTIVGGTKSLAGETGHGALTVILTPKTLKTGKFTATFATPILR